MPVTGWVVAPKNQLLFFGKQIPNGHVDYLHEVNYPMVATKDWFIEGLSELISLAQEKRIAVLCSEENPVSMSPAPFNFSEPAGKRDSMCSIFGGIGLLDPAMQPIVENIKSNNSLSFSQ
jgi:hypothetical protein